MLLPARSTEVVPIAESDLAAIRRAAAVALDIECDTNWKDKFSSEKYGLSYVTEVTTIALAWKDTDYRVIVRSAPFDPALLALICDLLNSNVELIAHNAVYDLRQLAGKLNGGVVKCQIWDTMVMARLLHSEKQDGFSLAETAQALGIEVTERHLAMKGKRKLLHEQDQAEVERYCAADTLTTYKIYETQYHLVDSETLNSLKDWEVRAMRCYCQMAARGVRINVEHVEREVLRLSHVVKEAEEKLSADGLADPAKRTLVTKYLYTIKGLPIPEFGRYSGFYTNALKGVIYGDRKKKTTGLIDMHSRVTLEVYAELPKPPKTKKAQLALLAAGEQPAPAPLVVQELEGNGRLPATVYKTDLSSLSASSKVMRAYVGAAAVDDDDSDDESDEMGVGLYVEQLRALAHYVTSVRMLTTLAGLLEHSQLDGRAHSLVTINTVSTRRVASHPQVQNWHLRATKDDPAGDMCGVAIGDEGATLVEIDFSNAENLSAAFIAADNALAEACMSNDFHAYNSAKYFGERFTSLDKEKDFDEWDRLRNMSKTITFGTAYGMGARTLGARLGVSVDEARAILDAKDAAYWKVAQTRDKAAQKARTDGYINLWTGRKLYVQGQHYRAWNFLCQGGVAEMTKRSIVVISETFEQLGMRSYIALDMHDAIIINVYHEEWEQALSIASTTMETIIPLKFNQRTTPPISWTAQPEAKKNAKKWGKFQAHPGDAAFGAVPELINVTTAQSAQIPASVEPTVVTKQTIEIADLGFRCEIEFRPDAALAQLSESELRSAYAFYNALFDALDVECSKPRQGTLPVDASGQVSISGNIQRGPLVDLTLNSWAAVPLYWLHAAQNCDVQALIGKSVEELHSAYNARKALVDNMTTRVDETVRKLALVSALLEKHNVQKA